MRSQQRGWTEESDKTLGHLCGFLFSAEFGTGEEQSLAAHAFGMALADLMEELKEGTSIADVAEEKGAES